MPIVESIRPQDAAKPYNIALAKHFDETGDFPLAERYYVAAARPQEAVDMYWRNTAWDKAHKLASTFMSPEQVKGLYMSQAQRMEASGNLKDAEKLYVQVGAEGADVAISMYKNHRQFDEMLRLVAVYHPQFLEKTHEFLAKTLESEGNYKQAEYHFVQGKMLKSAYDMYKAKKMFEEAYRVFKLVSL